MKIWELTVEEYLKIMKNTSDDAKVTLDKFKVLLDGKPISEK